MDVLKLEERWPRLFTISGLGVFIWTLRNLDPESAAPILESLICDLRDFLDQGPDEFSLPLEACRDHAKQLMEAARAGLESGIEPAVLAKRIEIPALALCAFGSEYRVDSEKHQRQDGARKSATQRRKRAEGDPARSYLAAAFEQLTDECGRSPGRPALVERAQQLAAREGQPSEIITDHKARRFLAGD